MYSERFKQKLLAPIRKGVPAKHIAAQNGVSYNQVIKWCKAEGIKLLKGGIREKGNYSQRTLDIITLLQCDVPVSAIAVQLEVSSQWIYTVMKREGL